MIFGFLKRKSKTLPKKGTTRTRKFRYLCISVLTGENYETY